MPQTKQCYIRGTGFHRLRIGNAGDPFQRGNEPTGSISHEFIYNMRQEAVRHIKSALLLVPFLFLPLPLILGSTRRK